jgi:multicomponent Na+:H+ antiporter subunit C
MNLVYALMASVIVACSVYMILSRNLVRLLLGMSMLATGVNIVIFHAGGVRSALPPLIEDRATRLGESADPLPQALVLTAIVIGLALTLVLAALTLKAWRAERTLDTGKMRSAADLGDPARAAKQGE